MSRDAKDSLTALVAVLLLFGALWLIPLALKDVEIPKWAQVAGFGLQVAILVALLIRRRRHKPVERPE